MPASVVVGTSGSAAARAGVVTAMPFTLPDVTSDTAGGSVTTATSIWFDSTPVSACAAPGNGMCSMRASEMAVNRCSITRCGTDPVPGEP